MDKLYVEEKLDHFCNELTANKLKALQRWIDLDDNYNEVKEIKEKLKLLLYNKKYVPLQTKELIEDLDSASMHPVEKNKMLDIDAN